MEKIYKTMRNTGAASIAVGIIVASCLLYTSDAADEL